jgi:calcium-dependent protein kinase
MITSTEIGTGGFAEVRRCVHKITGMMRAVKIYNKSLFPDEYLKSGGLHHEIEILKKLDHPNLVKLYEYYEDEKSVYITMEFCLGGELFQQISSLQRLTEESVIEVMRQLFAVVSYIHSKGIVHRDLKPENILIEERGSELHLKIADFGNAVLITPDTKLKGETGTCYYMAPEVMNGEYSEKCDEWSCGVIMFMLLTGKPPFDGENDEAILANVKKGEFSLNGPEMIKVSADAKDLISKLLIAENFRISAAEALNHSWFGNKLKKSPRKDTFSAVSKNLRSFQSSFRFKEAMKTFITSQILSNKEIKPLREVFTVIDSDNDGKINREDLIDYFRQSSASDPETEAQQVMSKIDREGKGFIEYSQYIKASIDSNVVLSRKNLGLAFNMMDSEKKGFIRAEDLVRALSDDAGEDDVKSWKSAIQEVSKKNNGLLSFDDFVNILSR